MNQALNKQEVRVHTIGIVPYEEALVYQQKLRDQLVDRKRGNSRPISDSGPLHHLILCQHPPVFTLGKSGKSEHLLMSRDELSLEGVSYHKASRGGDITFHGPGQLVCYPIFDLDWFYTDVHRYVRSLEEAVIRLCSDFGLSAFGLKSFTGVWLGDEAAYREICAIGVHLSRWVTMHGLALNVNTELRYFDKVIPCGITDENKEVTSLEKELGRTMDIHEIEEGLLDHLRQIFHFELIRH